LLIRTPSATPAPEGIVTAVQLISQPIHAATPLYPQVSTFRQTLASMLRSPECQTMCLELVQGGLPEHGTKVEMVRTAFAIAKHNLNWGAPPRASDARSRWAGAAPALRLLAVSNSRTDDVCAPSLWPLRSHPLDPALPSPSPAGRRALQTW
jgi:hypothetical protein